MPSAQLKSFAEKSGKSMADLERYWEEAKKEAKKKFGKKSSSFWKYVVGIVERRAGLRKVHESLSFSDFLALEAKSKGDELEAQAGALTAVNSAKHKAAGKKFRLEIELADAMTGKYKKTLVYYCAEKPSQAAIGKAILKNKGSIGMSKSKVTALTNEALTATEVGWYVEKDDKLIEGPMEEQQAMARAKELGGDAEGYSHTYVSDYELERSRNRG